MDLRERLNQDLPQAWKPEPGDILIGKIVDIQAVTSRYADRVPVLVIRPDDGGEPVAVWASHTVLRNELARTRPQIGQRIGIKFLGKRPGRSGGQYAAYRVVIEGDQFDWGAAPGDGLPADDDIPF